MQDSWEEGQGTAPSSPSYSCPFFFLGTALCQPIVCMEAWLSFLWLSTFSPGPALRTCVLAVFSLLWSSSWEVHTSILTSLTCVEVHVVKCLLGTVFSLISVQCGWGRGWSPLGVLMVRMVESASWSAPNGRWNCIFPLWKWAGCWRLWKHRAVALLGSVSKTDGFSRNKLTRFLTGNLKQNYLFMYLNF